VNEANGDANRIILATGISAGAVWHTLQDLARSAAQLPAGELHDTWTTAAKDMMKTLDDAQRSAKLR
jgi:hypothetical protein